MARDYEDFPILVAQAGPLNGQRFTLDNNLTMGRENTCDIVIPDRQVSRYHARITRNTEGALLEDLGSKNGTHYNGQLISRPILLKDGDVIQVALIQQFLFLNSDATATMTLDGPMNIEGEAPALPLSNMNRLRLEKRSRRVWVGDQEVMPPLSASQFRLLELLYDAPDQVVRREEVIHIVWGEGASIEVSEQALDALIRRLRDRLATVDPTHIYITTVRGHGLRLDNPAMNE